ncbi:hypothetical protein [Peribacillus loiseleuriae]|uniref:hypothetical protein n=1 Tax=Peribacillus loiseleuriae TaxID=1679170 RepID=UPI003CFD4A6F
MKELLVGKDAINSYVNYFNRELEKEISSLYNEDFVYINNDKQLSFVFLDDITLVLILSSKTIIDLSVISYDYFVSDRLTREIMNYSHLSPRLERYKALGILRFKEEIKENLQLGNICVVGEDVLWVDYNLKIKLNDTSFVLESINH